MPLPYIALNMTAFAVASIFYAYRDAYVARLRRLQVLRERVAYMVWSAAQQVA
ncbi:MAG TPA: hypothetical protein VGF55_09870 [Gemmataceae bacterium]